MALADEIAALRVRSLAELTAAHDYFTDTRLAWRLAEEAVSGGRQLHSQSSVTATVTTHADLVARAHVYMANQLQVATFQNFLSIFESFLADFLRAWMRAYPKAILPTEPVAFDAVLDAADKDEIVERVIDRKVYGLFYQRPAEWFRFIEGKAKLGCPTADEVARLAEAKATRDAYMHNRGVATAAYVEKAGPLARGAAGEPLDVPEPYHRQVWELTCKIVADMTDAAAKFV